MRVPLLILMSAGMLLGAAPRAQAVETQTKPFVCPICHRANDPQSAYPEKAAHVLLRGAVNTAFGWTELLVQPAAEANAGGNIAVGIGKGIGEAIKRTAVGVGELFTFWTPKDQRGQAGLATDCPICLRPTVPPATKSSSSSSP